MNADEVRAVTVPHQSVIGWRWPNFTPEEIACRGTGLVPDPASCPQFVQAMDRLQRLRDYFGVPLIVTSAYRTPEHNHSIAGAARHSKHMLGIAFDVSIVNVDPHQMEAKARETGFKGIGRYPLSRFIHIDMRAKATRWGKDWPLNADRFDPTTERPDGVEGMIRRAWRRFLGWVAGGGSVAVVIEHFTNVINRTGQAISGLPLPSLPSWPILLISGGALLAGVALLTIYRNRNEDEYHERTDTDTADRTDNKAPGRRAPAPRVQQNGRILDASGWRRFSAIPAAADPRRRWAD